MALHGTMHSWGDVLDAGTGVASFTWLSLQPVHSLTAVTVELDVVAEIHKVNSESLHDSTAPWRLIHGDWRNASLLADEQFDVVVCDCV